MSVAYYIVLDNKEPGFDPFVNGKVVAHAAENLEKVATLAGIQPLESFMGQSSDELMDMLSDDFDDEDDEDSEDHYSDRKWFEPSDGIALIDALAKAVRQHPQIIPNPDEVIEDLEEYKDVLQKAASIKAKWHFAIDF